MSFNAIQQLLDNGFSDEEVLNSLVKTLPKLAKKASKMLSGGWGVKDVLSIFSRDKEAQKTIQKKFKPTTPAEIAAMRLRDSAVNIPKSQNEQSLGELKSFAKTAAPVAIGALGSLAAPMASAALSRALPQTPQLLKDLVQKGMGTGISPLLPETQTQGAMPATSQTPPINTNVTPIIPQPSPLNQQEIVNKIKELSSIGKSPADIVELFTQKAPEEISKVEKETGKKFIDFIAESVADPAELARRKALETFKGKERERVETAYPELQKQSIVATPQGVGEVEAIRNGQAIVNVNGKKIKVSEAELEPEPQEVSESQISFDINEVPENLRSAPLNEVYVPGHKKHITVKFNSNVGQEKDKRYLYFRKDGGPIDQSIIDRLREGVQLPVTSGENFWGAWDADTQDSRDTVAFHELTRMAQREGEEDDPSKPYWFVEEEEVFTHGFRKEYEKRLKEKEKAFNEKRKKRKKKPA